MFQNFSFARAHSSSVPFPSIRLPQPTDKLKHRKTEAPFSAPALALASFQLFSMSDFQNLSGGWGPF
jgi:hypothetical protein